MKCEQKFGALLWTFNQRRRELWVFKTGQCTRTHCGWTLQGVCGEWMIATELWLSCWPDVTVCNFYLWAVSHLTEAEFDVTVWKATQEPDCVGVKCRRGKTIQNTLLWNRLYIMWTQKLEISVFSCAFRINIILKNMDLEWQNKV